MVCRSLLWRTVGAVVLLDELRWLLRSDRVVSGRIFRRESNGGSDCEWAALQDRVNSGSCCEWTSLRERVDSGFDGEWTALWKRVDSGSGFKCTALWERVNSSTVALVLSGRLFGRESTAALFNKSYGSGYFETVLVC